MLNSKREKLSDPARYINMIHVESDCLNHPVTRRILARATNIPVQVMSADNKLSLFDLGAYPRNLTGGKQNLVLSRNRGKFFKPCPGTREYICCDYQVLNIGMNCPMDCVYCILQAYLNNPYLSFFVNTEDLLSELTETFTQYPDRFWRIGTGEFTDSLALDNLTGLSRTLVEFMRDKESAVLELKSKSTVIENLRELDHGGRTIVAWSLNAPDIVAKEEIRTATLEQRLAAAVQCASWGYKLAFHFDPIIFHTGWQQGYTNTIERLFATVPREKIVWISLGCLRYLPTLKKIATLRFPHSHFFQEEFIEGLDGKARYFRTLRVEMYRHLYKQLKQHADPRTCIYLCMENNEIWREVFGFVPEDGGGLPKMLDEAFMDVA
jgi:DNA repair photolyase